MHVVVECSTKLLLIYCWVNREKKKNPKSELDVLSSLRLPFV